jgi:hypothetical protein
MERFRDRQSRGVFTEMHIAKLTNLPIRLDAETQTKEFIRKKQLRFKMKEQTGVHKSVQVVEADIFDFDKESAPVVKVLVNQILQEARLEAWNEGESKYLRNHKIYLDQRDNERIQKMRNFEKIEQEKRENAIQKKKIKKLEKEKLNKVHEKLLSRQLSKEYIKILREQAVNRLNKMKLKKKEEVQNIVQNEVISHVEDMIYQKIGLKEHIKDILIQMVREVKEIFGEENQKKIEEHHE